MPATQRDSQATTGNSLLPKHPFVYALNGQISSGKSTALIDLATTKDKLFQKFDRIIVIAATIKLDDKMSILANSPNICKSNQKFQDCIDAELGEFDETYEPVTLPKFHGIEPEDLHTTYSTQIFTDLIDYQEYTIESYGKENSDKVLVIIDDSPVLGIFSTSHKNTFSRFCCVLRHYNCSVLFCTQMWKAVSKLVRNQCTYGSFFETNEIERKEIWETFSCGLPFRKFEELFQTITNKPYTFISFNTKNKKGYRVLREWNEFIC